jgi:5-formyltetrahydrofolate cyclo-ligase
VPVVAFDPQGNRLGMGGGHYDRSFAFRLDAPASEPPV